jgi:hypothetical protein
MKISEIKECPTVLDLGSNDQRFHESIFRSYQILEKVKELLEKGTPGDVVLEIIQYIEECPKRTREV